ncbi:MAG TPA: hypothetical protein VFP68_22970 [Burkholderiaceae bacterium]|nr:hypothetical protein [Burkholderiaceae bacterium]
MNGGQLCEVLAGHVDRFMAMSMIDFGTGIREPAPTSILSSMMRAAKEGILINGGRQVEQLAKLRTAAFDKTGTQTRGVRRVIELAAAAEV